MRVLSALRGPLRISRRSSVLSRAVRDRLRVSAVANRVQGGERSGTPQQGPLGSGLLSGLFSGSSSMSPFSGGREVKAGATAAGEKRPNRAPAVTPTQNGTILVSVEAFEEQLDLLGLKVEGRLGKGSRAQVFDVVSTTDAHGWKAGQSLAVKALIGEPPRALDATLTVLRPPPLPSNHILGL